MSLKGLALQRDLKGAFRLVRKPARPQDRVVEIGRLNQRCGMPVGIEDAATFPTSSGVPVRFADAATRSSERLAARLSVSKRGNSLRVMFEAVRWGARGARINTISPGIIMTPLAKDELTGPRGAGYRRMIEGCPAKRAGTPDEVGNVAALLMGPDGAFITGGDFLMDGGVTSSYWFGELAPT